LSCPDIRVLSHIPDQFHPIERPSHNLAPAFRCTAWFLTAILSDGKRKMSAYVDEVTETLRKHMAVEARRDGGARVFFDPAKEPDHDEARRIERAIREAQAGAGNAEEERR
jgi:hypothetical protein